MESRSFSGQGRHPRLMQTNNGLTALHVHCPQSPPGACLAIAARRSPGSCRNPSLNYTCWSRPQKWRRPQCVRTASLPKMSELNFGADRTPIDTAWTLIFTKKTANEAKLRELFTDNAEGEYIDSRRFTTLHRAVLGPRYLFANQWELLLLHSKDFIHQKDSMGLTSLAWACTVGDARVPLFGTPLRLGSTSAQPRSGRTATAQVVP